MRRRRVEPTDDWAELKPLLQWPAQEEYEGRNYAVTSLGSQDRPLLGLDRKEKQKSPN